MNQNVLQKLKVRSFEGKEVWADSPAFNLYLHGKEAFV